MKSLATLALALVLLTATGRATLAHVDALGQPDPYWQQIAAASAASGSQVPADGTAAGRASVDAEPLDIFVYASGGISLLLVVSLLRSLWTGRV